MNRIRSIHPGLFTDKAYIKLTVERPMAILLLMGLWCESDDAGAFEWEPLFLKARFLPATGENAEDLLEALSRLNFIKRFEVEGRDLGVVRNFMKWQRPKKPSFRFAHTAETRRYAGYQDEAPPSSELASSQAPPSSELASSQAPPSSELAPQREEGRKEEGKDSLPPSHAGVRASSEAFAELTTAEIIPLRTPDALEAEAIALSAGLPLAKASDFAAVSELVASGAVTRGDVVAALHDAARDAARCPKTWASLGNWAREAQRQRVRAEQRLRRSEARGPPMSATKPLSAATVAARAFHGNLGATRSDFCSSGDRQILALSGGPERADAMR